MDEVILTDEYHLEKSKLINYELVQRKKDEKLINQSFAKLNFKDSLKVLFKDKIYLMAMMAFGTSF